MSRVNDQLIDQGEFDQEEQEDAILVRPIDSKRNAQELVNWLIWGNVNGEPMRTHYDARDVSQIF